MNFISTYHPEEVVIKVGDYRVFGLAEHFLDQEGDDFYLTLRAGADSCKVLRGLCEVGCYTTVEVQVALDDNAGSRITDLDIYGQYQLRRVGIKLGTTAPVEVFKFIRKV